MAYNPYQNGYQTGGGWPTQKTGLMGQQNQTYQPPTSETQVHMDQPWDNPNYQEPKPPDASLYAGQGAAMTQADQSQAQDTYMQQQRGQSQAAAMTTANQQQANENQNYNPQMRGSAPAYNPTAGYNSDPSSFNTQYGTPQNVNQYMNPFLQSIMDRGNKALSNWDPQKGTTDQLGAFGLNGYNPAYQHTDRQAATMANLNAYADPSYQFRLQQGVNGLDASAAAKGGLLSSGHMKDLTDYSQGLASTEYQNMYNRFTNDQQNIQNDNNTANNFASGMLNDSYARASGDRSFGQGAYQNNVNNGMGAMQNAQGQFNTDRNYMTNQYNTMNAADTANNHWENTFNNDNYWKGNDAYTKSMNDYYNQSNGITNTGINATNNYSNDTWKIAQAIAGIYGNQGDVNAQNAVNNGNSNSGMMDDFMSYLSAYKGGGK